MKTQFLALCTSILAGLGLGCPPADRLSIKVGGLLPLTGEAAGYGASTRNGYELAQHEWNARGGVLGRPVVLALRDDHSSPAEALSALTQLVEQDRVVALLGASLSKVSYVAAPIVQSLGIPMVSPTSSDPQLTAIGDQIYRVCCTDQAQGDAAATFARQDLRAVTAACIFDKGSVYPSELAQAFRSRFTRLGGRVVAYLDHRSGTFSSAGQIARVVQAQPDVLYIPDYYAEAALIARMARAQGFRGILVGGDGWDVPAVSAKGGLESGFFTCNFCRDEDRPVVQDFVRKYRARYHKEPDACAALAYDAGNVLFDAIQRAGATDGPALKAALAGTNFPGVSGQIRFDQMRNPTKPPLIIEIKGGRTFYRGTIPLQANVH